MNKINIRVPYMEIEGIETKIVLRKWFVNNGDIVTQNAIIAEIENDFAIMEIPAEITGKLSLIKQDGDIIKTGEVICIIE